jgi:hypothetical protein
MERSKVLVMVIGSNVSPWNKNWIECSQTWVPLLKQLGYHVKISFGDEHLDNYFIDEGDSIRFKSVLDKSGLFDRALRLPLKWITENTDYEYYVKIDSDTFVHPIRFSNMLEENINDNFDYMGTCIPYRGWNPNTNFKKYIHQEDTNDLFFASGAGFVLNRRVMKSVLDNLEIQNEWELSCEDYVLGKVMKKLKIPLLHDNRICLESPFTTSIINPHNITVPYIGDRDSHLAIQHYLNGYMYNVINDLIK